MPKVTFSKLNRTVEVIKGASILEAAVQNNIPLFHTCGGNCSCSTCRVIVLSGDDHLTKMEEMEKEILDSFDLKAPHRLGCQSLVLGDVTVDIPERDKDPRPNKTPAVPE